MNKIIKTSLLLLSTCFLTPAFSQQGNVSKTTSAFPYEKVDDAGPELAMMQAWDKKTWRSFLLMLDGKDSAQVTQASYALSAYTHHAAMNAAASQQATLQYAAGLKYVKSFYGRDLLISQMGLLGDDAAVKTLAGLLSDNSFYGNAARALAMIHTEAAMAALTNALASSKEPARAHIQQALYDVNIVLPALPTVVATILPFTNDAQLLLQLQDRMETAKNPVEKKAVLAEAARIPGFPTLMFAGRFLDDADLNHDAALIATRIALADKTIRGKAAREVLEKAIPLLKGEDSAILAGAAIPQLRNMPYDNGFVSLFNGKDLTGWKALVGNPLTRAKMTAPELAAQQKAADEKAAGTWIVKDGLLVFTGHGDNLATVGAYSDFEMYVDWKITPQGDAGIYLRGSPQVQIWDTSRREVGAQVGSGGLYNNQQHESKPLLVADNPVNEWNNFHIIMQSDKVTVYLNGVLVTDHVVLENYWDRNIPIFPKEQIELQAHGTYVAYRNIYLKDLEDHGTMRLSDEEKKQGFVALFDGTNMNQWTGDTIGYKLDEGTITVHPELHGAGNLYTREEYADFEYRFEFQLTPGANNGLGIRAPLEGDAAYVGMELQILDNEADKYKDLHDYQYHGSVYGVIPAKRGYLLPTGEWNKEEVVVKGNGVKVTLNGVVILDGDIATASRNGTLDKRDHPGLKRTTGHIGFLGHGDVVRFRNIRVKRL